MALSQLLQNIETNYDALWGAQMPSTVLRMNISGWITRVRQYLVRNRELVTPDVAEAFSTTIAWMDDFLLEWFVKNVDVSTGSFIQFSVSRGQGRGAC